jgi:hypothetical protein
MMQVAIMQIIRMAGMSDSHMAAGGFVLVVVPLMLGAGTHRDDPPARDVTRQSILASLGPCSVGSPSIQRWDARVPAMAHSAAGDIADRGAHVYCTMVSVDTWN